MQKESFERHEKAVAIVETNAFSGLRDFKNIVLFSLAALFTLMVLAVIAFYTIPVLALLMITLAMIIAGITIIPTLNDFPSAYVLPYQLTSREADKLCDELEAKFRTATTEKSGT